MNTLSGPKFWKPPLRALNRGRPVSMLHISARAVEDFRQIIQVLELHKGRTRALWRTHAAVFRLNADESTDWGWRPCPFRRDFFWAQDGTVTARVAISTARNTAVTAVERAGFKTWEQRRFGEKASLGSGCTYLGSFYACPTIFCPAKVPVRGSPANAEFDGMIRFYSMLL
ncbi:hypothetical protein C8R44DRAFT_745548 [Mycena epipterygia]|nr:hypothetical protein C8R44DRAFT_745548 [Mycena epipterygia]